jgi:hypothetical protein
MDTLPQMLVTGLQLVGAFLLMRWFDARLAWALLLIPYRRDGNHVVVMTTLLFFLKLLYLYKYLLNLSKNGGFYAFCK